MAREYSLCIPSWEKYQGRQVKTRSSWLRLQNDFIENPNFGDFTSDERIVWLFILCCASKLNKPSIHVPHQCSHRVLHRCTGIGENVFHRVVEKLKKLRIVEVRTSRGRYADDTSANADDTLRDETGRNETGRDEDVDETERNGATSGIPPVIAHPELFSESTQNILAGVSRKIQDAWVAAYQDVDWIKQELAKGWAWIQANPQKRPKNNCGRFMTNWLSRGWENHRKTLPSNTNNPAYRRMAGNQAALAAVLESMGVTDEQAS